MTKEEFEYDWLRWKRMITDELVEIVIRNASVPDPVLREEYVRTVLEGFVYTVIDKVEEELFPTP